ncbi:MAG: site-specific integrase [Candidatus Azobacteroides sp.]|nr:site-specific integrase [Candidatus Azobacteroides sp.]
MFGQKLIKLSLNRVDREYLTDNKIEKIRAKQFPTTRLEYVRDIFIFSCYTGLAYIVVQNLPIDSIRATCDDSWWLIGKRVKTDVSYRVPLMNIPKQILDKYANILPGGLLLPVINNQKMIAYLKEIGALCEIDKGLSFHLDRHICATTSAFSNDILWKVLPN